MIEFRPVANEIIGIPTRPAFYDAGFGPYVLPPSGATPALNLDFTTGLLDPRITFSRPSNATFYDSTGKLTYAPSNLLTYSEDFSNSIWTKVTGSISANATIAPDGTLTGDAFTPAAVSGLPYTQQNATSSVTVTYTWSVYLKSNGYQWAFLDAYDGSNHRSYFDLTNGVVGSVASGNTSTITSVGNGWYRCSLTRSPSITSVAYAVAVATSNGGISMTGNGVSGIYLWGAQLEAVTYQTTPRTYNATTAAVYYGPRFEYDPVTLAANGLLVEEARTNLCLYSSDYSTVWFKTNSTTTPNTTDTLDPSGVYGSTKFAIPAGPSAALGQTVISTAVAHTASIYLKVSTGTTTVDLILYRNSPFALVGNKTVTLTTSWQRFTVTGTFLDTTGHNLQVNFGSDKTVYVYGAQIEAGSFETSYLPTVASPVARSADVATMTGANFSSWYSQSAGTFVVNYYERAFSVAHQVITNYGPTVNDRISFNVGATNILDVQVDVAGVDTFAGDTPTLTAGNHKIAFAYETNNAGVSVDGSTVTNDNTVTLPTAVSTLVFGAFDTPIRYLNSTVKSVSYYNTRLSNTQLQSLST